MKPPVPTPFPGFRFPTTTPIPDELFDALMAALTGAELKVLLYICRRTFGFKKASDTISLNQIANGIVTKAGRTLDHGTGLSKRHVQRALKSLEAKNAVQVHRQVDADGQNEVNTYSLKFIEGVGTFCPHGGDNPDKRVGTPLSPTINRRQQTERQQTVSNGEKKSGLQALPALQQPPEKTAYVAQFILDTLGDQQSQRFYTLVAAKVPESVIRQTLAEIRADGARRPERVFTQRMKLYALQQQKKKLFEQF